MSRDRFHSGFECSDDLIVIPRYRPGHQGWRTELAFPWFLGVAPIDYQSRLEAQMTRHWGSFDKDEEDDAVVGEVDGIEIRRSVTVSPALTASLTKIGAMTTVTLDSRQLADKVKATGIAPSRPTRWYA